MGCKNCSPRTSHGVEILSRIKVCIKSNEPSHLKELISLYEYYSERKCHEFIDERIIKGKKRYFSLLGYAVWSGSYKSYKNLIQNHNASFYFMMQSLEKEGLDPLNRICEKGYLVLLKMFYPEHCEYERYKKYAQESSCVMNSLPSMHSFELIFTPIQLAVFNNHLSIVSYFTEYHNQEKIPKNVDLHHVDEYTGENCALVACRAGNFPMVMMLHEKYEADFHLKNKRNESVFQIIAAESRKNSGLSYLECLRYVTNIIKVDITYMHEETLLLFENRLCIKFFEEALRDRGIITSKKEVESLFRTKKHIIKSEDLKDFLKNIEEFSRIIPCSAESEFQSSYLTLRDEMIST
ncbi:hypothetical protein SteCoe_28900 [Stentor coeruleus]|uniref:Uncharacterized protein n=1 Tax=Stentor coeruleus TaxID=5963 RepID=A0A1R2B762_9CILI|nr:hypothetical protein SteCoe_28900 [Stentor coeruleus]